MLKSRNTGTVVRSLALAAFVAALTAPPARGQSDALITDAAQALALVGAASPGVALEAADAILAAAPHDSFARGQWTFQSYLSTTFGQDSKGELYLLHAGVGYFFADSLSINLEGVFGYTDAGQPGVESGATYGFDLLVRWHFWRGGAWSVYMDGGAGMVWFEDAFPLLGTRQNFSPQAGFGFTYNCENTCHIMAGFRWHHVSNAGRDENPGYDGVMIYAGVVLPF